MAGLRDGETMVSDKNDTRMGPSGKKARNKHSAYLVVGGSSCDYDVTVNFETKNGHWCQKVTGERCHGNGNGKARTYGQPQARDKRNPIEWCKHVQAALASENLQEAMDRTAAAFGEGQPVKKAEPTPEPVTPTPTPEPIIASARERLAAIEAEKAAIVAEINGKLAAIFGEYGADAVNAVIDECRAA
jgi:hypothetical protein